MRLKYFKKNLRKKNIDAALFLSSSLNNLDPNIRYFAGLNTEFCALLIPKSKKSLLIISSLEEERAKKASTISNIAILSKKNPLSSIIKKYLPSLGVLGVNYESIPVKMHDQLKKRLCVRFKDISQLAKETRIVKSADEIKKIKKACNITGKIFRNTIHQFHQFNTEGEVRAFILQEIFKAGGQPAFSPIVASGKNAAIPHSTANKKIKPGFCIIDFGVKYDGYCSDMTRTVYLGRPSQEEINVYYTILAAQEKALKCCKPGTKITKPAIKAREELGTLESNFIHSLGHGVGVEIHEAPHMSVKTKGCLKKNMILTVEPGVYIPDKTGIRIEDTIVVLEKPIRLTTVTKKLLSIT